MNLPRIVLPIILVAGVLMAQTLFAQVTTAPATRPAATRPAILKLLIPDEAIATVDGEDFGAERSIPFQNIANGEAKRVAVKVQFANGAEEERLVDLDEGQTIPVPVPVPQPDKSEIVAMQVVDPVLAVALSPDGQLLAIGLESNAIVLWDLKAARPGRTLSRHRAPVQSLVFSADGKRLLSGSGDNTAVLWDLNSGTAIQTYKGHTDQVMSVAFSPDGQRVLTASMDKTAVVWNAATAEKILTITGHKDQVFGAAYSLDGKVIGTASLDRTGALWDAETGSLLFTLRGHSDGVSCVLFSPDGKTVATGSFDNSAIVWDIATGKKLRQTGKHEIDVYGLAYTRDGRRLLTAARDEVVMMWDSATGKKLRTFTGHNSDVGGAAISPDGRSMFSCSRDGMVKLWDLATGMELASLMSDASTRSWAVVTPEGLFDASEPGRRMMGFRFSKGGGGSLDQFFHERFHPGLLAELYRGGRPLIAKPLGHAPPPLVKIISPKTRSTPTTLPVSITVEATDQGGGLSSLRLMNNGSSIAVKSAMPPTMPGDSVGVTFDQVALAPGVNQLRVVGANGDDSWESVPADIELTYRPAGPSKKRMYVVAVGDSRGLIDVFRNRPARVYDRVDVIALPDRAATKERIEETLADLATLLTPQDSLIVVLRGAGSIVADRVLFTPLATKDVLTIEEIANAIAVVPALRRAMVVDLAGSTNESGVEESALRGAIEKLARSKSVHILVSVHPTHQNQDALQNAMLSTARECGDLMEWFHASARQANGWSSTQPDGFPVFETEKR